MFFWFYVANYLNRTASQVTVIKKVSLCRMGQWWYTFAIGARSSLRTKVTVAPYFTIGLTNEFTSNPRVIRESREMVRGKDHRLRVEALRCWLHGPPPPPYLHIPVEGWIEPLENPFCAMTLWDIHSFLQEWGLPKEERLSFESLRMERRELDVQNYHYNVLFTTPFLGVCVCVCRQVLSRVPLVRVYFFNFLKYYFRKSMWARGGTGWGENERADSLLSTGLDPKTPRSWTEPKLWVRCQPGAPEVYFFRSMRLLCKREWTIPLSNTRTSWAMSTAQELWPKVSSFTGIIERGQWAHSGCSMSDQKVET